MKYCLPRHTTVITMKPAPVCVCVFLEAPSLRNMADTMATALHCYCFRHDVNGARVVIEQTHVIEKVTFNKHL